MIWELPVVALRNIVILPGVTMNVDVGRPKSKRAVDEAQAADRRVLLLSPRWYVFVQWRLALDWPVQARRFPTLGYDLLMMHVLGAELVVCRAHEPS